MTPASNKSAYILTTRRDILNSIRALQYAENTSPAAKYAAVLVTRVALGNQQPMEAEDHKRMHPDTGYDSVRRVSLSWVIFLIIRRSSVSPKGDMPLIKSTSFTTKTLFVLHISLWLRGAASTSRRQAPLVLLPRPTLPNPVEVLKMDAF